MTRRRDTPLLLAAFLSLLSAFLGRAQSTAAVRAASDASAQTHGMAGPPQFAPGIVLRYRFEVRSLHEGNVTGAIEDPQGGDRLSVRFAAVFKLEALSSHSGPQAAPASSRPDVRATIEQVSIVLSGDTFDPSASSLQQRYEQLEGFSIVLPSPGDETPRQVAGASGGDRIEVVAKSWLRMLVAGVRRTITEPGKTWSKEEPILSAPLNDTVLRTKYTYLRDEPCGGRGERAAVSVPSLANEPCAVILAVSSFKQSGSPNDRTPDDYRARGLRSTGKWEGTIENLAYISRRTDWVVSITETQSEQMDFTISRTDPDEAPLRHRGQIETQTNLLLQSVESKH